MSLSYINRAEQGNRSALYFVGSLFITCGALLVAGLPIFLAIVLKGMLGRNIKLDGGVDGLMSNFPYPISYTLLMSGFVLIVFAVWFSVRFVHRRKFGTIWSEEDRFRPKDFLKGLLFSIAVFGISDLLLHYFDPGYHTWVLNPKKFLVFLPLALVFIPIQTLAEELLFRGHFYQTSGLILKWVNKETGIKLPVKWIAVIFCSIIFGAMHFGNSEMGINFWKMGLIYIGTGFMIGLTVIFSKGIEFGWAFHLINNLYLSIIVTFPGSSLNGPTLYTVPKPDADRVLLEFAIQFVIFTLALVILYRKNLKTLFSES